jgi:quercetin dioxygenase-like cupin family protein
MEHIYTYIDNLNEQLPEIPPDSIVSRTIYQDDENKAILFGFAPGQELSEHTAAKPAILHFLEGKARLTLGEHAYDVQAGAWVHMPANLRHSIEAENKLVMLLVLLPGES